MYYMYMSDDNRFEKQWHNKFNEKFYSTLILNYGCAIEEVTDKERQLKGIDVILTLPDGRKINIDEKARQKSDSKTLGVELFNRGETVKNKIGWFLDENKVTDLYLYGYTENHKDYALLIDKRELKQALDGINLNSTDKSYLEIEIARFKFSYPDMRIHSDDGSREKGLFLLLPIEFYLKELKRRWLFTLDDIWCLKN